MHTFRSRRCPVKTPARWTASGLIVGALLAAADTTYAAAETAAKPAATPPAMQRETLDEVSATVTAVNSTTREITLKGEDGRTGSYVAGPEVKNFAQIKAG